MLIIERAKHCIGGLQENIQAAPGQPYVEIGNLARNVAHCHVESTALLKRKAAQVVEKIIFKRQPIFISLLEKLFAAQAKCVAWFPGNVLKKATKSRRVLLLFFQADVAIYFDKAADFLIAHLIVTFPR